MREVASKTFERRSSQFSVRVDVHGPAKAGHYVRQAPRPWNPERRTSNIEPNLNTNREVRTAKFELQGHFNA
jgi:hypothetical protein